MSIALPCAVPQRLRCVHPHAPQGGPALASPLCALVHVRLAQQAVANGKRFSVYVTEARPDSHGELTVKKLRDEGIQATLLLDAAVGAVMERIDIVLVGAEGMCHGMHVPFHPPPCPPPPAPSPPRLKSQSGRRQSHAPARVARAILSRVRCSGRSWYATACFRFAQASKTNRRVAGVVENGGVINKIGSYQVSQCMPLNPRFRHWLGVRSACVACRASFSIDRRVSSFPADSGARQGA